MDSKPTVVDQHPERAAGGRPVQPYRPGMEFLLDALANAGPANSSDVTDLSFLGAKRPGAVTFDDPPPPSGGGGGGDGTVLCRVEDDATTGFGGLTVSIVQLDTTTGKLITVGNATLILPEIALGATIPKGTIVLGHPASLIGIDNKGVS